MRGSVLYYVRHGETVWNTRQRLQGRLDSPLTRRGISLAIGYGARLREQLPTTAGAVIHSSPMGRAHQTAVLIAEVLGLDPHLIEVDALLAEHDVGDWGGRTWDEVALSDGRPVDLLRAWDTRPPGGESRREMAERARRWLAEPRDGEVCIAVSHGGFSRVLRGAYLGLSPGPEMNDLPVHAHGRLYRLADGRVDELVTDEGEQPAEKLLG